MNFQHPPLHREHSTMVPHVISVPLRTLKIQISCSDKGFEIGCKRELSADSADPWSRGYDAVAALVQM